MGAVFIGVNLVIWRKLGSVTFYDVASYAYCGTWMFLPCWLVKILGHAI